MRGHAGDVRNERVDEAAEQAAERAYEAVEQQRKEQAAISRTDAAWALAI